MADASLAAALRAILVHGSHSLLPPLLSGTPVQCHAYRYVQVPLAVKWRQSTGALNLFCSIQTHL